MTSPTNLSEILNTDYIENNGFNTNNSKISNIYEEGKLVVTEIDQDFQKENTDWSSSMETLNNDLDVIDTNINTVNFISEFDTIINNSKSEMEEMDISYNENSILVNDYENKRQYLKNRLKSYHSIVGKLKDAKMDKYYFLFIIWIIIFFIILFTLFFNIVESQTSMNILSKGLLFIFVLYVLYYILKNIYLYFNGYR